MSFRTKHYFLVTILYALLLVGIVQFVTGCGAGSDQYFILSEFPVYSCGEYSVTYYSTGDLHVHGPNGKYKFTHSHPEITLVGTTCTMDFDKDSEVLLAHHENGTTCKFHVAYPGGYNPEVS
jgi:hypothetical protein